MKTFFTLFSLLFFSLAGWATHNRAGEITYTHLGGNTYEATITTYTKESSIGADQCDLVLFWGDGTSSTFQRLNGPAIQGCPRGGVSLGNDVKLNIYKGTHTYGSSGVYILSVEDPNRNAGIVNIPQSVNVPFYVQSEIFISPSLTGGNSSPILTNPPIDDGCLKRRYEHSTGAYDVEGDSLHYELVDCRGGGGVPISTTYGPNVQDPVTIDPVNGLLIWDKPQKTGLYNFAIQITEWRKNGSGIAVKLGYVTRDLQVDINPCDTNDPPVIQPLGPFCVEAGQNLNFDVTATDINNDPITLRAFGGPIEIPDPATFNEVTGIGSVTGTFDWDTKCRHVSAQPYYINFEAKDDPSARSSFQTPLVDILPVEITVVAPAPKNPMAVASGGQIDLSWDASVCDQATGYKIYRREGLEPFVPGPCETGVPEYTSYELLDTTFGLNSTTFSDDFELIKGRRYCYLVVACFADGAESYASVEFCANLEIDEPLMTKVDVLSTSEATGEIQVSWIPPPVFDTANFPPPYAYKLYRAEGINGTDFSEIQTLNNGLLDTTFKDENLNTESQGYRYFVELYSGPNQDLASTSSPASSVFLQVLPADESNVLRMTHNTPWRNDQFVIYRENPTASGNFEIIDTSFSAVYIDTGLVNGDEYCYRTLSIGAYTAVDTTLPAPLKNNSQIDCAIPLDTAAPCAPLVSGEFNCEGDFLRLEWDIPMDSGCVNDIVQFNIYYKSTFEDEFGSIPLASLTNQNFFEIRNEPVSGCYAVTAVDDAGSDPGGQTNESVFSEIFCVEPCPTIEFPNVFTPDGDNVNDFFTAIDFKNIRDLDITIFNRWGNAVYQSSDAADFFTNGWDGTDMNSGQPCADGVYFYSCNFSPLSLGPPVPQRLEGFFHLFRGKP